MDTILAVIQVLLALLFAVSGLAKLLLPYDRFTKLPAQLWANDFKPDIVRLIGALEVAAVIGIVVPLLVPSLTLLAPLATVGMALVLSGAVATHLRRTEYVNVIGNLVWVGLALFVAYGRLVGFAL